MEFTLVMNSFKVYILYMRLKISTMHLRSRRIPPSSEHFIPKFLKGSYLDSLLILNIRGHMEFTLGMNNCG